MINVKGGNKCFGRNYSVKGALKVVKGGKEVVPESRVEKKSLLKVE